MKIIANDLELDIKSLFIHENHDCSPFSEAWIAEQLNQKICDIKPDSWQFIEILPPDESGFDRFIVLAQRWDSGQLLSWKARSYSEKDLKDLWPKEIYDVIMSLEGVELSCPITRS